MSAEPDFDTIAKAIRFLEVSRRQQPSLEEAARHVGMSKYHFQRLFTQWAGVSPKRFLQFLTVAHAKQLLREAEPVLQTSFEVGLSGPSRLHDLFVTLEAVTPGEFKRQGESIEIRYGFHETPFGRALLAATERGICHLSFLSSEDPTGLRALEDLEGAWPKAHLTKAYDHTAALRDRAFPEPDNEPPLQPLSLFLKGTNFQVQVWKALLTVPPGSATTYGRLARSLGRPTAARAVGNAVARNPVAYLIPCHRVIRESGHFGDYRWGATRKQAILGWEASRGAA
jgi:AraC family transcriptional regulator of adaptative response/methylated-DNA-[protein]-cysteine methyltransferase